MSAAQAPQCLGVLGGMGPLAGAHFLKRLIEMTPAGCDQEHICVLLRSDPRVPDRTAAMLHGGRSPLPDMMQGIALLVDAGADCIAIPCNTAHLWYPQLAANSHVPILHIVDAVLDDLAAQGVADGPIGLLATPATLALDLYQPALRARGYDVLVPQAQAFEDCVRAIELVKASRTEEALAPASRAVASLAGQRARAVVLACTELPLALPTACRNGFDVVITDSVDALARRVLAVFRPDLRAAAPIFPSPTPLTLA